MSDERDEELLELLARDLDGDLDLDERRDVLERLAAHPDRQTLLRIATGLKRATDTLARASDSTPAPDMTGFILDAVEREAKGAAAPHAAKPGLLGALKTAFGRGKQEERTSGTGGRLLGAADLMGVVAGTGAPAEEGDAPLSADDQPQADPVKDQEKE